MNNRRKTVIAAVLAAVMALTGCNSGSKPASSTTHSYSSAQGSTVSTASDSDSTSVESKSEPAESSSTTTTSEPEESSTSTTSKPEESSAATSSKPAETSSTATESKADSDNIWDSIKNHTCSPDDDFRSSHWHTEDIVTVEATKDNPGEKLTACKDCGKVFDSEDDYTYYYNYFDEETTFKNGKDLAETILFAHNLVEELGLNSGNKTDIEKLCILKKWFCMNTNYESVQYHVHDLFIKHKGNCMAYAEALCYILPKCGIETYYVGGDNNHAFNIVKINGQWTYTDFTEGDGFDVEIVMLGTSGHGVNEKSNTYQSINEKTGVRSLDKSVDKSSVSKELHVYDLDGNELRSQMEADGFSYVDSNGQEWKFTF